MKILSSVEEIIEILGGYDAVMELTGAQQSAVGNWVSFKTFPSNTFKIMTDELKRRRYQAPPHLWKMRGYKKPKALKRTAA